MLGLSKYSFIAIYINPEWTNQHHDSMVGSKNPYLSYEDIDIEERGGWLRATCSWLDVDMLHVF